MTVLLLSLAVLAVVALCAGWMHNRRVRRKIASGELDEASAGAVVLPDSECCGQHEVCEKDSLLAAVSKDIEYYNDEELDAYAGISGSDYTEGQTEEFREILYTMRDDEVAGWVRSLQLRGIELPSGIRDEVFLLVGERRGR